MTRKLALVQPNFRQGPTGCNSYYLPYSLGVLWAFARTKLHEQFEIEWIFRRDPMEEVVGRVASADVVAFSTYVWNKNYNYELARRLKALNPKIFTIFGGPEPPITDPNIFKQLPFADVIVKQEGEIAFAKALQGDLSHPGLLINRDGVAVDTGESVRIDDLNSIPSPYLEGLFDDLLVRHPEIEWNTVLETNRGCPYQCTFCDWGSLTYSKVKKFDEQRVMDEIEWMGKNRISYINIADANFGIFVNRDNRFVDKLLDVQTRYGFPYRTSASWAKNQKSEVVRIAKKMMGAAFNNGLTISVQSMDENTLDAIKRRNMEINKIGEIVEEANAAHLPVATEMILGLPVETIKTWKWGLYELMEMGQHNGIEVFQAQLLENAEMNFGQKLLYGIKGREVADYIYNSSADDECAETVTIVTETRAMPRLDMVEAWRTFWFINTWHVGGFSQLYARFARKHFNVRYEDYYEEFRAFVQGNEFWKSEEARVPAAYASWLETGAWPRTVIGGAEINGWNLGFSSIMMAHHEKKLNELLDLAYQFFKQKFPSIEQATLSDLRNLSGAYITRQDRAYPFQLTTNTNLHDYIFDRNAEFVDAAQSLSVEFNEAGDGTSLWFLENMYFARRRAFGRTLLRVLPR